MKSYAEIFGYIIYAEESDDYAKETSDYVEIFALIKLFPWFFQTHKILVNILLRIKLHHGMFDLLLPFVDSYFFVQRSFSIVFSPKLSNQAFESDEENWIPKV